jgi:hypothetical protein
LAIPIIFSQIDGICYDLTSKIILGLSKSGGTSDGMTDLFFVNKNSTPYNAWEKKLTNFL